MKLLKTQGLEFYKKYIFNYLFPDFNSNTSLVDIWDYEDCPYQLKLTLKWAY